uniref:Reverse transcriptase RNase H-like domain-containing protein n=1 Tax=Nicotiana tabacum TaxID=4097 RepID=A0A1S4A9A2_TOBAC|nr:PREDICTED: uncharacterized protein LOC107795149 [Nicotiana tabacum]
MLQLDDRSIVHLEGLIEDVLLQIGQFILPADFIIWDYEADEHVPIIVERTLLATADAVIKVRKEKIILQVDNVEAIFNDTRRKKMLRVLREHQLAIRWTMADICGIIPSFSMHKILMEDGYKPSVEHQRCLNPVMKEVAYEELKKRLVIAPIITALDWGEPFELMCDATDTAIGAVLGKRKNKVFHSIYYAIKTLNLAHINYTVTEKELLVVVWAFDKFRAYMVGTKVIVYTDHAAIRYLFEKKDAKPRAIKWVLLSQEFNVRIRDRKGTGNQVVDHLSHLKTCAHIDEEGKI